MAIKKPNELDFRDKKFMCIIAGQPGLGKTTLALSAPKPFLFDADNGIARVRAEQRSVTSVMESYEEMLSDMQSDDYKAAESIVIDTGGMLVQLMKDWAKKQDAKAAKDGRAMYGVIKTEFDRLCYQIRLKDKKHLVVVFHTTEQQKGDTIQTRLSCEGGTKNIVWTPADFGGYMFMMGKKRMIGFTPTDEYFAKGCFGVHGVMQLPELEPGQKSTFLADLFRMAQENIDKQSSEFLAEKEAYDAALREGRAYIALISDGDTANKAADTIKNITHALTSREELGAEFKRKLKELGIRYDREKKSYVLLNANDAE